MPGPVTFESDDDAGASVSQRVTAIAAASATSAMTVVTTRLEGRRTSYVLVLIGMLLLNC